ncbi:MAG: CBS domain-containing membrane protein [Polaromonas sp.]|jgi:CBS domain-containing membrane protein
MKQKLFPYFGQDQTNVSQQERYRAAGGAFVGLFFTMLAGRYLGGLASLSDWTMASLGASALLVFVLPSSPMAQPWAVIGGNLMAAVIGIVCVNLFDKPMLTAPVAVGLSILCMFVLRCLHPPAAAVAMITSLGSISGFQYALFPVLTDSLVLVVVGVIYNNLTGKPYPYFWRPIPIADQVAASHSKDIDAVLSRYNQVIDINRADLAGLIGQVELRAYEYKLKGIKCADIMSTKVHSIEVSTPLDVAWKILRDNHIKALPVIDLNRRVVGIVTLEDFLKQADIDLHNTFGQLVKRVVRSSLKGIGNTLTMHPPDAVGQIMSKKVRVISESRNVLDLVEVFHSQGHHHLPVIDRHQALVGIITQSDFVAAIERSLTK